MSYASVMWENKDSSAHYCTLRMDFSVKLETSRVQQLNFLNVEATIDLLKTHQTQTECLED